MFIGKNLHGLVENIDIIQTAFLGALSFVVNDSGIGHVMVLITTLHDSPTQINILTVHEKSLIQ